MKTLVCLGLCWVAGVVVAPGQTIQVKSITARTVSTTKHTRFERELLRFLVYTHEAESDTESGSVYKVPLLVNAQQPGIGVYKFGLLSAHAGHNVVFRYRHQLVFSSARASGPLLVQLRHFLTQYPTAFTPQAQRTTESQLRRIMEQNQTVGEGDLPTRKL
jgi:hypothetical protein